MTAILHELGEGNREALGELIPHVYDDLYRMAVGRLRGRSALVTWRPTELVNELYLRLAHAAELRFVSRAHFFAVSARAMRAILVDHARAKGAAKRVPPDADLVLGSEDADHRRVNVLAIDEALDRLRSHDARVAQIVECRCFAGMTIEEVAEALAISAGTVKRDWRFGRAWLLNELGLVLQT